MTRSSDMAALNDWQVIGRIEDIAPGRTRPTRLLGQDIIARRDSGGTVSVIAADNGNRPLPVQERYGHVWTSLGTPERDLLDMPEFAEEGRRLITCGGITVRTSPLRIVENFLDLAHFPYVHTDILGIEPQTDVADYKVEIRQPEDEIWATECRFFQPQAAKSASGGQISDYMYRVSSPFVTILYKTCPIRDGMWDLIGLFVQPMEEEICDVHSFVLVFDEENSNEAMLHFQQMIFLQDRSILENQRPARLPLNPRDECAITADRTSVVYRRWLRDKGLSFGAIP
ncbi:MAG: aromatic ring-hydroxylating dioxygenase subunit alpha [Rhodospirillales bacterium]|nr:aromatic ring-hydroxylating dioxygenase subunit alpha [Rhodospirillales bacterium]